ncbi:MAG: hypothetical protein LN416_08200 [Candidatus Thermoplasmatota archaeon]|nr:hypothetical protein [Candidatus Thermoplasmatota archaeon]
MKTEEQANCVLCQRPLNEGEASSSTCIVELEEGEVLCLDCGDRLNTLEIHSGPIEVEDNLETMLRDLSELHRLGKEIITSGETIRDAAGYLQPFQERLTTLLDRWR